MPYDLVVGSLEDQEVHMTLQSSYLGLTAELQRFHRQYLTGGVEV